MIELHYWIVPVAALIPMFTGFIWYNPKVMGTAWMHAADLTEEKLKNANMLLIMGMCYVFANMLAFVLMTLTIHQMGVQSVLMNEPGFNEQSGEAFIYFQDFLAKYGANFRTFKHGALHGFIAALFIALPLIGTNALFERKSWKYIWIHTAYWAITLLLMGGVVCQFA